MPQAPIPSGTGWRRATTESRLALGCLLALCVAGCAPRTGDLGRPEPSYFSDRMLPAIGRTAARARGEPVSGHALTDRESELRRRSYRFIMPVHRREFFAAGQAQTVKARIWPDDLYRPDPTAYHRLARADGYRSEVGRYSALREEIDADILLLAPFYDVVRAVYVADRHRIADLGRTVALTEREERDALARVYENRRVVRWALAALAWRVESYGYALQRLRIEAPSGHARAAEADLAALAGELGALEAAIAALEAGPGSPVKGVAPSLAKR